MEQVVGFDEDDTAADLVTDLGNEMIERRLDRDVDAGKRFIEDQ